MTGCYFMHWKIAKIRSYLLRVLFFPACLRLAPIRNVSPAGALICWKAGQGLEQERSVWNWQSQSAWVDEAPFAI